MPDSSRASRSAAAASVVSPGLVHHLDVRYVAVAPQGATPVVSEESTDVRWWPVDALPEPDTGLVAQALARLESPSAG